MEDEEDLTWSDNEDEEEEEEGAGGGQGESVKEKESKKTVVAEIAEKEVVENDGKKPQKEISKGVHVGTMAPNVIAGAENNDIREDDNDDDEWE